MSLSENKIVKNDTPEKKIDALGLEIKDSLQNKEKEFCKQTIKECGEQMETMTEIISVFAKENQELKNKIQKLEKLEMSNKLKNTIILVLGLIILISYYRNRN